MRRIVFFFFFLMSFNSLFADNSRATELLDKAATKFKNYPAVEISFSVTMDNKSENVNETNKGTAYIKGNKYRLLLMGSENYFDGKYIYTYMPEVEEVNIKNPSGEEEEFLNPSTLYSIYNKGFNKRIISTEGTKTTIELIPDGTVKRNFSKLVILINTASNSIEKVTSYGSDGNRVIITILSVKEIKPLPADTFFKFDTAKHPDVEVIDLRD